MPNKTDPTPIPAEISDREYYGFHVLVEGVEADDYATWKTEAEKLKTSLLGSLAKAYPDRWSSVAIDAERKAGRG